jgi:hypothetical protein
MSDRPWLAIGNAIGSSPGEYAIAKGHGSSRRERLQRPVMMVARLYRSITWAALAFERGFPAITFDVHLQDRGMVHEPVDSRQRHGLVGENLAPFAEGPNFKKIKLNWPLQVPLPLPGMLASAFSKSGTGDEAAAAPEGQIGPEPCSQNSNAVARTHDEKHAAHQLSRR